jgi:heme exporter protein B
VTVRDGFRTAALVAGKDLRIEWRSKVGLNQVLPFAAIVMVIFAFALDRFPNAPTPEGRREGSLLQTVAPGLVWLATLFSLLLLVQRTFSVESEDGALDALRAAGMDAGAMFWGKTLALAAQLAVLEALLLGTAIVLYGVELRWSGVVLLVTTWLAATVGLAAVGTLYGGLAAGARGRETLLPLLLLPVVAPVLIGATRAVEAALGIAGTDIAEGWPWVGVVAVFAIAFGAGGTLAFGPLIDE